MASPSLVLASRSPRRIDLLSEWGVSALTHPADIDETFEEVDDPAVWARTLAERKATVVRDRFRQDDSLPEVQWVLGADTVVSVEGELYGKPSDAASAVATLEQLSGRHDILVATGVALLEIGGDTRWVESDCSQVVMKPFSLPVIKAYVETGEPFGKAGAFAVQGKGAQLVERVEGSFSNVVGLPRSLVESLLARAGIL